MAAETARASKPIAARRSALIGLAIAATIGAIPAPAPQVTNNLVILRIDPNTAPAVVLETLPRIGPAMAARIIEARPFADLDDLDRGVLGIGPATRAAIEPHLRFDGVTKDR